MIKEVYCSYDLCELLKAKGLDYRFIETYHYPHKFVVYWRQDVQDKEPKLCCNLERGACKGEYDKKFVRAITHQVARAWLREEKHIFIEVYVLTGGYAYRLYDLTNKAEDDACDPIEIEVDSRYFVGPNNNGCWNTYEDVVEYALEYVLTKVLKEDSL